MEITAVALHKCAIVHYGLRAVLEEKYDCNLLGAVSAGEAQMHMRSYACNIMFIELPEFTSSVASFTSSLPVICLSDSSKVDILQDAISLGASGYLLMSDEIDEYYIVLESALKGKLRARSEDVKRLINKLEENRRVSTEALSDLTSREVDVLELLVQGKDNKEIADELSIAYGTARNKVWQILSKTHQPNRTALALWAVENNIVDRE